MNLEREIKITINGTEHKVDVVHLGLEITLNTFLRSKLHLTGTKRMCLEGGCGVCIVAVQRKNNVTKKITTEAINSCLVPIFLCNGWKILTIEGISNSKTNYHHLQKVLADFNGSQCGFCSPGMVMNMYCLTQNEKISREQVENSFGGNICRCTGYRPILEAFKSVCDIEDVKVCHRKCSYYTNGIPSYFNLGKSTWIKVSLMDDLLQVLKTFHNSTYMLVAGNTSTGVYKSSSEYEVYIDVTAVDELTSYEIENNCIVLGANMSLTETMQLFNKMAKDNFLYLKKMADHIDLIANIPVRNLGTLAGNLMIKYHHNDFPSDIYLILETVNAILLLVDIDKNETRIHIKDLLKTSMTGKIIKKIILPPLTSDFKYGSYKIMPRAQNAHALVNAGFLLQLNEKDFVQSARITYGSINPSFIHATRTEEFLIGKYLYDNETLQKAFTVLDQELDPKVLPSEPTPLFRKQLAIALFYKYILSITPKKLISPKNRTGALLLQRSLVSGNHLYETDTSRYPVTQPMPKNEAIVQTSGQAEYIMDMPDLPNQLFGVFVLAKVKALATIRKIDTSEAMKLQGVVAFFTKDDIPGRNNFMPKETNMVFLSVKEEIFCSGLVQYYNQPIGLLVATSQELAEKAASLVRVSYNPGKQPVLTIQDCLKSDGKKVLENETKPERRGNNVSRVIKGRSELSWQYHYHMETQCCNVVPTEDGLDIYPSSQWLDLSQTAAATTLNLPLNKINVTIRRLGGAFGAKISRNSLISSAAALAAYKLKRPVKIWLPFETNMNIIGKRYPMLWDYEMGVDDVGTIQYLDIVFYSDYGAGGNEPNIHYVLDCILGAYKTDSWHVKAYSVNTNNHASCYIRAPGTCEGLAIVESIMEHAAMYLGIDGIDFRLKNLNVETHKLLVQFIKELYKWADIDLRKQEIKQFNINNRWKKKGLAVVPMVYHFHLFGNYEVLVSVYKSDGSVSVAHGGVEMGQGINTKVIQVCAYKLGIPVEKISVKPSNNLIAPNAHMVGGSLTSETVCYGVIQACDILLERMKAVKNELKGASWEEIVQECYNRYINLSSSSMGSPKELKNYTIYGVCCSEIELDVLTGQHVLKRVDLIEDAGTSMNPNIDRGQVEGAFVMGMGYFTSEQIIFNENGELLTNRTWNYKSPGAKDIPVDFRIKFPNNTPNDVGVLNSKAVGEPPLCLACSVPLAIRHAVASARSDADGSCEKWYPFSGPSTVENTFLNCLHDFKHYTL